nr:DNA polymerase eta isoform X1 [Ciona intestinalis]|eukprot:XP_026696341.1 DNA polymerase eta isoform X1 [Ciona intestinalis]
MFKSNLAMSSFPSNRVVVLVDMDCFYVQVEQRRDSSLKGKPCAVVQYNQWKGGGIIAVSYEARDEGVTRNMRGDDAKAKCPEIILCKVPMANGKADLTRYRDAGAEVIQVLLQFGGVVERASVDEAYIDLTSVVDASMKEKRILPDLEQMGNTYVVGYPKDSCDDTTNARESGLSAYRDSANSDPDAERLLVAAAIVEKMRLAIYQQTSFRCSAGISHNKMLSKLSCGINKPNKQTILPFNMVAGLFQTIKIGKIRNLGGKLGKEIMFRFGVEKIGHLTNQTKQHLVDGFGEKTGLWLYEVCHGIDHEPVKERHVAQSVGCSKNFTGNDALGSRNKVKHWVRCLTTELVERLNKDKQMNNRVSHALTIHIGIKKPISRTCPISRYDVDDITMRCLATLETLNTNQDKESDTWSPKITNIGISAKNFQSIGKSSESSCNVATMLASAKAIKPANKIPEKTKEISTKKKRNSLDTFLVSPSKSAVQQQDPMSEENNLAKKFMFSTSSASNCGNQTESGVSKKKSFFAHLENKSGDGASCKIEAAYLDSKQNRSTGQLTLQEAVKQNNKSSQRINGLPALSQHTYDMKKVDMNIFNSLPQFLQEEIRAGSKPSTSESPSKKIKLAQSQPTSGQKSITGFFGSGKPQLSSVLVQKSKPKSDQKNLGIQTKGAENVPLGNATSVPMGYFRARTQAAAAIQDALKKQRLNTKLKPTSTHDLTTSTNKKQNPTNSHKFFEPQKRATPKANGSLWSSFVQEETYHCDRCSTNVALTEIETHSNFHALQDLNAN